MEILKESSFEVEDSYGVIYQESNIQKIIAINYLDKIDLEEDLGFPTNFGILEVRICDFNLEIRRLLFDDGVLSGYEDEYEFRGRRKMTDVEANLKYFAKEFKFAFETNSKLKKYLPTVFGELMKYLNIDKF